LGENSKFQRSKSIGNVGHLRGEMPGEFAMKPFQLHSRKGPDGRLTGFTTGTDPRALKWQKGVYE
jgi:hypothetical protein